MGAQAVWPTPPIHHKIQKFSRSVFNSLSQYSNLQAEGVPLGYRAIVLGWADCKEMGKQPIYNINLSVLWFWELNISNKQCTPFPSKQTNAMIIMWLGLPTSQDVLVQFYPTLPVLPSISYHFNAMDWWIIMTQERGCPGLPSLRLLPSGLGQSMPEA